GGREGGGGGLQGQEGGGGAQAAEDHRADDADDHRHDDHYFPMSSRNGRVRVAVLMGGRSSEHEISMASARSVLESLDPEKYEVLTVEIDREGQWELGCGERREVPAGRAARAPPAADAGSA